MSARGSAPRSSDSIKRLTLVACILGSGIALLDGTVVNVALPTIQRDLGGGLAAQQWVVNAYLLTLGSLILIGGSLGDLFGERRIFALGVGGFGVASLLCALAPSIGALIAARALQGVAARCSRPSALAVIVATFPESERGPAIGSWTAWGGIATVLGPLAGGELLAIALVALDLRRSTCRSWSLCLALILLVIPRAQARPRETSRPRGSTWLGALLCALGLGGPVFALIEQPRLGWASPAVSDPADRRRRAARVLRDLRGSRARSDAAAAALSAAQLLRGQPGDALDVCGPRDHVLLPGAVPAAGRAATRRCRAGSRRCPRRSSCSASRGASARSPIAIGPRLFMGAGPLVAAGGLLLVPARRRRTSTTRRDVLPALLLFALGLAMTVAPLTAAVLAGVEIRQAGIASARQQRGRARRRPAGHGGDRGGGRRPPSRSSMSSRLAGVPLGEHRAGGGPGEAKRLPLGVPMCTAVLPPRQATPCVCGRETHRFTASTSAWRSPRCWSRSGGFVGAVGVRNPRRVAKAAESPEGAGRREQP